MMAFGESKKLWIGSVALLLASPFAGWNLASWPTKLRYPGEENSLEGQRLAEMVHLRQGVRIYSPPSPEGFDIANYGPLYYLLGSRLVNPQKPAYLPLRLVSLLGTVGCAIGCGLLAFWLGRSYFAAALAPLVFLSYRIVTFHGVSARCDAVALFLSFCGFLIAYRSRNRKGLLLAAIFMLLGLLYKQQFLAAPMAVLLSLLLEKRYRLAAEFGGLMALGGVALLGFFQFVAFHGQAFLTHIFLYNALPFRTACFETGMIVAGMLFFFPLLIGLEFLRLHRDKPVACYVACALSLSIGAFAKQGSDTNHFLESALVLSALVAALLAERIATLACAGEFSLLIVSLLLAQLFASSAPFAWPAPGGGDFQRDSAMQDFLRRNFAPHTLALGYYNGDLLRAGLDTPISDLYGYSWVIRRDLASDRDLLHQLDDGRFGVVVLNFDLQHERDLFYADFYLTEPLRQAILADYRLAASLEMPEVEKFRANDRFYVWVPRSLR